MIGYTQQWYLPTSDAQEVDDALTRLEQSGVWVREADGSRKAMAALKDMTSQLIGRFCSSAMEATRSIYGPQQLTRYEAELVVPQGTATEIAVMKGLATTFVMTTDLRQPVTSTNRKSCTTWSASSTPPARSTWKNLLPPIGGTPTTTVPACAW